MARKFTIAVDEADDGVTLTIPEMPSLVTGGATLAEALANIPDAIEAVEELMEHDADS